MLASLIICTRNREAQLKTCLDYVSRLEDPPGGWQLVLVDNGSTDTTPNVIREFAGEVVGRPDAADIRIRVASLQELFVELEVRLRRSEQGAAVSRGGPPSIQEGAASEPGSLAGCGRATD